MTDLHVTIPIKVMVNTDDYLLARQVLSGTQILDALIEGAEDRLLSEIKEKVYAEKSSSKKEEENGGWGFI